MRRIRNPRYAPEFLERKLSPSGYSSPPADVSSPGDAIADPPSPSQYDYSWGPTTEPQWTGDDALSSSPTSDAPGEPPPISPDYPEDPAGPDYYPYSAYA